jgi:hypothetical protein
MYTQDSARTASQASRSSQQFGNSAEALSKFQVPATGPQPPTLNPLQRFLVFIGIKAYSDYEHQQTLVPPTAENSPTGEYYTREKLTELRDAALKRKEQQAEALESQSAPSSAVVPMEAPAHERSRSPQHAPGTDAQEAVAPGHSRETMAAPGSPTGGPLQAPGTSIGTEQLDATNGNSSYNFKPPNKRHHIGSVTQKTLTKEKNSAMDPSLIPNDVAAINSGQAQRIGDQFIINGRTYGFHDDVLYPISGPGVYSLDRGAFKALGVYNKFGQSPTAESILDKMSISQSQRKEALNTWRNKP